MYQKYGPSWQKEFVSDSKANKGLVYTEVSNKRGAKEKKWQ